LTNQQVRACLGRSAERLGGYAFSNQANHPHGPWNVEVGYGLVRADKAVACAIAELAGAASETQPPPLEHDPTPHSEEEPTMDPSIPAPPSPTAQEGRNQSARGDLAVGALIGLAGVMLGALIVFASGGRGCCAGMGQTLVGLCTQCPVVGPDVVPESSVEPPYPAPKLPPVPDKFRGIIGSDMNASADCAATVNTVRRGGIALELKVDEDENGLYESSEYSAIQTTNVQGYFEFDAVPDGVALLTVDSVTTVGYTNSCEADGTKDGSTTVSFDAGSGAVYCFGYD
jgi:hypothetical protein